MNRLTTQTPIGQWAAARPDAIRLFERYGIDYCCGGDKPMASACREAGVDPQRMADEIDRPTPAAVPEPDWLDASLTELCDHIEGTHHEFLREQLPLIERLIAKLVPAHAEHHPELRDVGAAFEELRAELEPHMLKEERILFPAIRLMEQSVLPLAFPFGSIRNPVGMMVHEHDQAGAALRRLRESTGGYILPEDACSTYRALFGALERLEADLHMHIHKENNILFPRAAELEIAEFATSGR